ncbi:uncharacterized protein LOC114363514 isoform X1 [Ostrinia furnacalis]|uniref:uncharacterized protein LOC114363514 isoform X1 n=1 Tax=Ostrinia furnacalis TaxID=93504 RepID=UPI00103BB7D8|nr:uncharacterized protein LOC114363514 isoform X1 [Ostrinia furnacalis]
MSWMKRPQGGAAPPGPDPQPFAAPQTFSNPQNMYGNYQGGTPGNAQPQQQFWQMPAQQQPVSQPQQYNQQYGQVYQQQEYAANANQYYPPPGPYPQGYNQSYAGQQGYQQNYYQNQGVQPNYPQNKTNTDGWEDNWDWGWDDSSKQGQKAPGPNAAPLTAPPPAPPQTQVFNNANVIEESFATTDSWNWNTEDKKDSNDSQHAPVPPPENSQMATLPVQNTPIDNNTENEANVHSQRSPSSNSIHQPTEEIKTLNDRDIVKERLPNLALGKRFHLDNLTPQWSIESQMSQESSDGPHTHSEGTYRSENQSRNSSKSSPGLNTESSNFNYSQSGIEELYPQNSEWSKHSTEEPTLVDQAPSGNSRRESHDELSNSLQEMSISNSENPAPDTSSTNKEVESRSSQDNVGVTLPPPPSMSPANFPPPAPLSHPPLAASSAHAVGAAAPPPTSSSSSLPPPSSFPPVSSQNPYKHAGPFSHKNLSKVPSGTPSPMQPFPPQPNLTSPAVVSKASQHNRVPVGYGANLETTPDNSERPDQPQVAPFRPMPVAPQVPDNLEVAPRNDRNEYLQTAHLSSGDYGENTDFSRNAPPPGLRRMVVGQQESEYSQNISLTSDEPPPGFARMVPGQQTESESSYNQPNDNYMDRHIDGGPIEGPARPYRQAEGQQSDVYTQPPSNRNNDRRPIGLDRMVPGEPSNDDYSQYQGAPYAGSNEQRVVTGLDHEYSVPAEPGPSDVREQNMDGSDYTEQTVRNPPRSVIGARESSNDVSPDYGSRPEEQQREVVMEGENLQDLSVISSTELSFSREPTFDGSDVPALDASSDRKADAPESSEHSRSGSRRQSLNHANTSGDDSERDRLLKSSPRRDKHKPSRDRDRDKEGRYSRGDRKYDRESERRSGRDERRSERRERDERRAASPDARRTRRSTRERDASPDARRARRSTRSHRYETDTDYYSDRERYQRRQREGSYTSKPPRHDGERRYRDERDRERRYTSDRHRDRHDRDRDRYETHYRDIDPSRKYGNLRKEREDDRKRVVTFSSDAKSSDSSRKEGEAYSPSRAESREPTATDDERDPRRRDRDRDRRSRHKRPDPYYDVYGSGGAGGYPGDPYLLQRQQYEYYERLRATDPAAYMQLYKLMAGQQPPDYMHAYEGYGGAGYDSAGAAREERASVHSGRSSTAGLKGNDTYFARDAPASLLDAPSLRTDVSDRDLNTDASLNLQLEESTVRSERMTPFRYSTAHIKGSISSRHLVVVSAAYPVDGRPARVTLASLAAALAHTPCAAALAAYPGPLVKGVTHKKSVIEYCEARVRSAAGAGGGDPVGYALVWDLLALLLRQNGVVVGTDIAELLMKNTREYEYQKQSDKSARLDSRRESSLSGARDDEGPEASDANVPLQLLEQPRAESASPRAATDEVAALDKLREYLTYGNKQEALEFAMNNHLWGHALLLAWYGERRTRAHVAQRFVGALPHADPLHTLYAGLAARLPPVATCVSDENWGDWRPHAAIILSNTSAKPEQDRRTLIQLGDTLAARGLIYSAQFCYISGGVQWAPHPLAPLPPAPSPAAPAPRLTLLLADPRAQTFGQHATNEAIFATEIYEYALSLNQDYVIKELQVYKLLLSTRLVDAGLYERALAYTEQAARAVTRSPRDYSPALCRSLASLADRLRYHDPVLQEDPPLVEEGGDSEPSPRHQQWLHDVTSVADALTAEASAHNTPQHSAPDGYYAQQQPYAWQEQAQQQQQPFQQPAASFPEPTEETADYPKYYGQADYSQADYNQAPAPPEPAPYQYGYEDNGYWQPEPQPYAYAEPGGEAGGAAGEGEAGAGGGGAPEPRPMITMPGAAGAGLYAYDDDRPPSQEQTDRETDTPKPSKSADKQKESGDKRSGWLGGILTRLSLRAPNQMILPDDKNPTIVWDAEHKRWRNLDADDDAAAAPPPPPPRAADLAPALAATQPAGAPPGGPPAAPTSNIFKMQKGRHIKKSYVDVFNPSGAATRPLPPAAAVLGPAAPAAPAPASYFVPQPTHQSGIYDPNQTATEDDKFTSGI